MDPTDKTRSCAWSNRQPTAYTSEAICQGKGNGRSDRSGTIFILNWPLPDREQFAISLRSRRLPVFVPEEEGRTMRDLRDEELQQADVIYVAIGRPTEAVWMQFLRICAARKTNMPPLVIVRVPRGLRDTSFYRQVRDLADGVVYGA